MTDKINLWFRSFVREIFIIHKKVLAVAMLLIGLPLLWLSLSWLLQNENDKPLLQIVGHVTKYDVKGISPNESVEIMIKPSNMQYDSLANKLYYIKYNETFNRDRFEERGGGLGILVKVQIDSLELIDRGLELYGLIFRDEEFINRDLRNKLVRENQWAAFIAAIMALGMGFGIFKLVGMIKFKD